MTYACTHLNTVEGGDLPAGKWCQSCGAKVDDRRTAAQRRMQKAAEEQRQSQQFERTQRELFARGKRT